MNSSPEMHFLKTPNRVPIVVQDIQHVVEMRALLGADALSHDISKLIL